MLLVTMAVPSIVGIVQERALKESFSAFDGLVRMAQEKSVQDRRAHAIWWEKKALVLRPLEPEEGESALSRVEVPDEESYALELPAALVKKPLPCWVFWPSGTCEPAKVVFRGKENSWAALYNPLTVQPALEALK